MKIVCIHQNFPGQYRQLAPELQRRGHQLLAISMRKEPTINGIANIAYKPSQSSSVNIHPWLVSTETAIIRAQAVAHTLTTLRHKGYSPDLILGHSGWGETLLVKDVYPNVPLINFSEFYYHATGADIGFDPEFEPSNPAQLLNRQLAIPVRNLHLTQALLNCDAAVTPTQFQASLLPQAFANKLSVIHDGVATDTLTPTTAHSCTLTTQDNQSITLVQGQEIITFIARNLEPMRGYHRFMRALPHIMQARPKAQVIIIGSDGVSYGAAPTRGLTYKQQFMNEVEGQLDVSRICFTGQLPYNVLMDVLKVSMVHVYLTYPFVLSWSMLEAMSVGAIVVGSNTAPVSEVIEHGVNGLLVDFFDTNALAHQVVDVLHNPLAYQAIRQQARQTIVNRYDYHTVCLPKHLALIADVTGQPV